MGVPSGSLVVDGIIDWLGETPVERGSRSKGNFCESAELESFAGGRLQAHNRLTSSRLRSSNSGIGNKVLPFTASHLGGLGILLWLIRNSVQLPKINLEMMSGGEPAKGGILAEVYHLGRLLT